MALPELKTFKCRNDSGAQTNDLDITGMTWCRVDNPAVAPTLLPPPEDPKSIAFDVPPCDTTDPGSTCRAVVKVATIGWRIDSTYYSFVLSGLQDGNFVAMSFTNPEVRFGTLLSLFSLERKLNP